MQKKHPNVLIQNKKEKRIKKLIEFKITRHYCRKKYKNKVTQEKVVLLLSTIKKIIRRQAFGYFKERNWVGIYVGMWSMKGGSAYEKRWIKSIWIFQNLEKM